MNRIDFIKIFEYATSELSTNYRSSAKFKEYIGLCTKNCCIVFHDHKAKIMRNKLSNGWNDTVLKASQTYLFKKGLLFSS